MSAIDSFKRLFFRVHLKPAPRTQSESNAILRTLQDFGPISTFQVIRPSPNGPSNAIRNGSNSAVANLVFARNTKSIDSLRNNKARQLLTITANANIPSANILDPYNVRGLKSRKPELAPREFECQITPVAQNDGESDSDIPPALESLRQNEYSDAFTVDRNSVFAEILARTDAPSGLIHGLLPKIEDRHRSQAHDIRAVEPTGGGSHGLEQKRQKLKLQGFHGQKPGRGVDFIRLDLDRLRALDSANQEDPSSKPAPASSRDEGKPYDEFAGLRDVSLMDMYRQATQRDGVDKSKSTSGFVPLAERD